MPNFLHVFAEPNPEGWLRATASAQVVEKSGG
jgi:hypothetical protein